MLPESLALRIRELGESLGGCLLLDSARSVALLRDVSRLPDLASGLLRLDFSRALDYTAYEDARNPGKLTFVLTLRAPAAGQARLIVKWSLAVGGGRIEAGSGDVPSPDSSSAASNSQSGDGTSPLLSVAEGQLGAAGATVLPAANPQSLILPSLSFVWAGCALAEREIFEMFGVAFSGHPGLTPLLLDAQTPGHPLRAGYRFDPGAGFAQAHIAQSDEKELLRGFRAAYAAKGGEAP